MDWSKPEKIIVHQAFSAAHERETMAIAHNARKMAAGIFDAAYDERYWQSLTNRKKLNQKGQNILLDIKRPRASRRPLSIHGEI